MNRLILALVAISPLVPAALAGCSSSSPSGGKSGPSSSSGSSSGFPSSSSGASSSGAGSSSGGGSSGGGSSGGGSSGGASSSGSSSGGTGDFNIASNIGGIRSLVAAGDTLVWIDTNNNSIESAPIAGGNVKQVVTDPDLAVDMTSDGTSIWYTSSSPTKGQSLVRVGMDGSGKTTVWSGVNLITLHATAATELFVVGGNVYVAAAPVGDAGVSTSDWGIFTLPTAGGAPTQVLGAGGKWSSAELYWVDSTGIYLSYGAGAGSGGNGSAPLAGGTIVPFGALGYTESISITAGSAWSADVDINSLSSSLLKLGLTGATSTTVQTYPKEEGSVVDGDAAGLYWWCTGGNAGLYSIDPSTGNQTLVTEANGSLNAQNHTMDAKNVYFVEVVGGSYSVWSHPR